MIVLPARAISFTHSNANRTCLRRRLKRTVAGLGFLQGCEARLRARMASLRPLKLLPDISDYWRRAREKFGCGSRAPASCVRDSLRSTEVKLSIQKRSRMGGVHGPAAQEKVQRQAGSSPETERQRQRQGVRNFLRSRPSSTLSFNAACQTRRTRTQHAQWSSAPQQRCRGANRWRCHWPAACDTASQHNLLPPQYMRRQHVLFLARRPVEMSRRPPPRRRHLPMMRNRHRT